jgi:hypothetical protein
MTTCACDGRYDGCKHGMRCGQLAGTEWGPFFCGECDPRRLASISASLASLAKRISVPVDARQESSSGDPSAAPG